MCVDILLIPLAILLLPSDVDRVLLLLGGVDDVEVLDPGNLFLFLVKLFEWQL